MSANLPKSTLNTKALICSFERCTREEEGLKERVWQLVVYLIDSRECGHVDAVNLKNGEGRWRRKKRRVTEGWGGLTFV